MNDTKLKVGDWVEVRSKEEILATLDQDGCLEGMPFMAEMFAFCGTKFQVYRSAHKSCDTVFPIRSRRIPNAVHLETRCDGSAHGGCQAGCLIFWKEAWLKPVQGASHDHANRNLSSRQWEGSTKPHLSCREETVIRRSMKDGDDPNPTYVCQATRLPYASQDLSPYDVRQYVEDYTSGNVGLGQWIRGIIYITYQNLINLGIGLGRPLRWLYDRFQSLRGGLPYPRRQGTIPPGARTPAASLDLREGEWVRVKPYKDILETCSSDNTNRGLGFDGEMVPYCGREFRVHKRVTQIINEKTGKMMEMKNPCIILENVVCEGRYSQCRMFCPRAIYPYWREVWLERVLGPTRSPEAEQDRQVSLTAGTLG
jgi:hypothetical protein